MPTIVEGGSTSSTMIHRRSAIVGCGARRKAPRPCAHRISVAARPAVMTQVSTSLSPKSRNAIAFSGNSATRISRDQHPVGDATDARSGRRPASSRPTRRARGRPRRGCGAGERVTTRRDVAGQRHRATSATSVVSVRLRIAAHPRTLEGGERLLTTLLDREQRRGVRDLVLGRDTEQAVTLAVAARSRAIQPPTERSEGVVHRDLLTARRPSLRGGEEGATSRCKAPR